MQYTLHLSIPNLEILHNHAETRQPQEAAALLFGKMSGTSVVVTRVELVGNEATSSLTSFVVNPEEQYRLMIEADEKEEELIGIFHSHPAPPYPSSRDKENMKLNPVVWLIASKETGDWISMAYIMENDEVETVILHLT